MPEICWENTALLRKKHRLTSLELKAKKNNLQTIYLVITAIYKDQKIIDFSYILLKKRNTKLPFFHYIDIFMH